MTTLTKILAGLIAALVILGVVQYATNAGLRLRLESAESDLRTAKAAAKANSAALVAKTRAVAQAEARAAATRKELDRALKANPEWAAAPVPDDVWRGLYERPADAAR